MPDFWDPISGPQFPNRGDQDRFWRMTRRFMEQLAASLGTTNVNAVSGGLCITTSIVLLAMYETETRFGVVLCGGGGRFLEQLAASQGTTNSDAVMCP